MENTADYKKQSVLYGVIFGLFSSLLLYFNYKFQLENTFIMSIVSFTIAVLLVLYPIHLFKLNNGNQLKISDALKIGLIVGLIGGLLYAFYTYLHYKQIDTEFVKNAIDEGTKSLDSQGNLSKEDLKRSKEMVEAFVSPFTFATFALIGALLKTFLIALVVGLIKKS